MKRADFYFSLALIGLSIFTFVEGTGYRYYHRRSPGSGFFPIWLSVLLFVLALANCIKIVRSSKTGADKHFFASASHRNRVIVFFIALLLYIVGISYLGMLLATFILALFTYKIFDRFSWRSSLPTAIGLVVFIHLIFNLILGLRLPTGVWNF